MGKNRNQVIVRASVVGTRLAAKPADREHPLGHGKTGVILMGIGIYAVNTTDVDLSD